ncbi:hypothetical protein WICMUC_005925 [Wickerhamomyces mucosus]|uniref:Cytochrome P450 n=1 Tax=Wickerhamomyces mucosus TaxID=1378264 RepID=A0A9P8T365_9ASCO|nr:hypothetical protein WICMUC_005925 [Wickerhamomyces mucosus]
MDYLIDNVQITDLVQIFKLGAFIVLTYLVISVVFAPSNFPKNIPTIPFYVSFLGTYTSMDQKDIYDKYLKEKLEKHGAVKIFFASRWNILVTRPEYLAQVFKDESTFAKSGNHEKIPYAVLSDYTGDNVISSHGEIWRQYRNIITQSIQFPELNPVIKNTEKFVHFLKYAIGDDKHFKTLAVGDFLQRLALANIGNSMLGINFNTLDIEEDSELHKRLKSVKAQIFKPLFMNFPILDILPIPSRIEARKEVANFRKYLSNKIKEEQEKSETKNSAAFKLYLSLKRGEITEKQFTDNIVIILVAGHENPQLFFTSLIYIMAKYPKIQKKLRKKFKNYSFDRLDEISFLNSVLFETLRLFPPLGQIINRKTSRDVLLGSDIHIPKNTYVGYNNFVTGRDSAYWGKDSNEFRPERWGVSNDEIFKNYKISKVYSRLSAFHGGRRACLGERFALYEARVFLKYLLENFTVRLDSSWNDRLTPAGPICPFMLKVKFLKIVD